MTCTSPLQAWQTSNGVQFKPVKGKPKWANEPMHLACRNCLSCRIDRTREWTVRIMHEASLHLDNMFITLTYDNEHLPTDKSLNHDHFQKFINRLRSHVQYTENKKLSYYMCGEYGDKNGRAHYHAIIFNYRYPDTTKFGKLFNSPTLEKHWGMGNTSIGNVEQSSARYVAGYIMKKISGDKAAEHYRYIDHQTGETHMLKPEYNTMSKRPGIGKKWFEKYGITDFGTDPEKLICHIDGKPYPIPKYYLSLLEKTNPDQYKKIMEHRKQHAKTHQRTEEQLSIIHNQKLSRQTKKGSL